MKLPQLLRKASSARKRRSGLDPPWWTTERTFSASRVYVRPPGTVELVQVWTPEFNEREVAHAFREEIEIGLPYRFQLDFYQNWNIEKSDAFYKGSSVELRYALANWGKIPLNPTLYGEWSFNNRSSDVWELKLLLGDTFCHRWNWATNLTYESETGGEREREIQISQALTYALIDRTLNVGVEALWEYKTATASNEADYEFLVGPSINVHPTRNSFVTVAPLFGATADSPTAEIFVGSRIPISVWRSCLGARRRSARARIDVRSLDSAQRTGVPAQ